MTSTLKQKTISGLTWSFIDSFAQKGITFIIGIILARLILPSEFGLIGMISIFIAISGKQRGRRETKGSGLHS